MIMWDIHSHVHHHTSASVKKVEHEIVIISQ